MAAALGITEASVRQRVYSDPELKALYAHRKGSFGKPADESPKPPDGTAPFRRRVDDLPEPVRGIELAETVAEMDRDIYREGLREYGVSEKQLKKLKALDGLAKDSGRLLSVSLQMTHQNYLGQLHKLADVADDLLERMKGVEIDGKYIPHAPEDQASLTKCYIECVKEAGKGYQLIMEGTQAMVRMIAVASGVSDTAPARETKWKPKKVNPAKD